MPTNEWIDLLLIAARDLRVLVAILFFLGFALIIISMVNIPQYGVKPENQRKAYLSGVVIAAISALFLVALVMNSMAVDVSGTVKNPDGSPARNVAVSIGPYVERTNRDGYYYISDVPRNKSQIVVTIGGKPYRETLEMPTLDLRKEKNIIIMPVNLSIKGIVQDADNRAVEGAWVNISWEKDSGELSQRTGSDGEFNFGSQDVPFVTPVPLRLFVQLSIESQPRNKEVLEIPSEDPYIIYRSVTLMPKDWVDVSGQVFLKEDYTDLNRVGFPDVVVKMADSTVISEEDGHYHLSKVPINTSTYMIMANDGRLLANHTIFPVLKEGNTMPRKVDLFVYKSELNNT